MPTPRVCIVTTGGTLATRFDAATGAQTAASGEELVAAVPGLREAADVRVVEYCNTTSDLMDTPTAFGLRDVLRSALADEALAGAVVTHGTATLEESAYLMDLTLGSEKPVVFTGGQRNFSEPDADGPRNVFLAARVAADPRARGRGVLVAMAGEIHAARDAIKASSHRLAAFAGRDGGPLGLVTPEWVTFFARPERSPFLDVDHVKENVHLIVMTQGMGDLLVRACIGAKADGIVIEGVGSANVNLPVYRAVCDALEAGIPVVIGTRTLAGFPRPHKSHEGSQRRMVERGAIPSGYLSGVKARILLMAALARTGDRAELRAIFARAGGLA